MDICYACDKLKMSRCISLAEGESKAGFEKDLAAYHNITDAAYLS
jgi:hypothetical protein